MPLLIEYSAYWRFNSWDGFAVPKPFSQVTVTLLPLMKIGSAPSDAEFENERTRVENAMTERLVMR